MGGENSPISPPLDPRLPFYNRFQFPNFIINVPLYLSVNMLKYKFLPSSKKFWKGYRTIGGNF